MSETEIQAAVAAERREQAELYATLTEQQWDAPSLCAGWRVREVLAHTTMPFRYSLPRVVLEVVKARGSFDRMADRRARRDAAELTSAQLLASLRDNVEHPWSPPGGGPLGALSHDVIHGLDVSAALGMPGRVPPERVTTVLAGMSPKHLARFHVDLEGIALRATDVDWSHGEGTPVHGCAEDLLLLVCGRRVPTGRLHGAAAARFTP